MKRVLTSLAVCTMALAPSAAAAQTTLTDTESRLAASVESRADQAIDFLIESVNINSGTMNLQGVREVYDLYEPEFESLGFDVWWHDGAAFDRAGHLVARHEGPGPTLLLIGHLDTVFEPSSPFQTFERDGDRATGPGVVDMKGGNAVIIYALKALRETGALDDMSVIVVMTGDEERSGDPLDLARAPLIEAAQEAEYVVAFENGDSNPATAVIARRGSTGWRLDVTGTPAHSSQLFQPTVGSGAIYEAARILTEFHEQLSDEPLLTFNPGVILGGTDVSYDPFEAAGDAFGKSNVVAESAVVTGDLRSISLEQLEMARQVMRDIVAQSLPGAEAVITFDDGYPPLAPSDGNRMLLGMFSEVSQALGYGPVEAVNPRNAGAADVSFTAGLADYAIDGLGPGGGDDHTVNEFIDLPTLEMQTKRAAIFLYRLTHR